MTDLRKKLFFLTGFTKVRGGFTASPDHECPFLCSQRVAKVSLVAGLTRRERLEVVPVGYYPLKDEHGTCTGLAPGNHATCAHEKVNSVMGQGRAKPAIVLGITNDVLEQAEVQGMLVRMGEGRWMLLE